MAGTLDVELSEIRIDTALAGSSPALAGVIGVPAGDGPWPAVVMVHEAFGITDIMRRQIVRLASAGYLVLMPDLFTDGGPRKCLRATFRALMAGEGRAFDDIEAARRALLARADCSGAIGVLGFCMGGGFALMASTRGFDVASVNYGRLPKEIDDVLAGACPIVASYGGIDKSLPDAAAKLTASLDRIGVPHDVKEYPDAGHSFLNDEESGPRFLRPILRRVLGAGPNPDATADAWGRIEDFFAEQLRAAPGDGSPTGT